MAWIMAVNMKAHVHLVLGIYCEGISKEGVLRGWTTYHPRPASRGRWELGGEAFAFVVSAGGGVGWLLTVRLVLGGEGTILRLPG